MARRSLPALFTELAAAMWRLSAPTTVRERKSADCLPQTTLTRLLWILPAAAVPGDVEPVETDDVHDACVQTFPREVSCQLQFMLHVHVIHACIWWLASCS